MNDRAMESKKGQLGATFDLLSTHFRISINPALRILDEEP
jgi:hypothetical protein